MKKNKPTTETTAQSTNKTNWLVEIEHHKAVFVNCNEADTETEAITFCKTKFNIPADEQVVARVTPMPSASEE